MANKSGHPFELADVETLAAARTLSRADGGKLFLSGAADVVVTLPDVDASLKGVTYMFQTVTLSVTTGFSISPGANDKIMGKGITSVDNKDRINTGASDAVGDMLEIVCDGVDGWFVINERGTWAQEA